MDTKIILASSSKYRRELLQRLQLPFEYLSPNVNEESLPHETPLDTCTRLAKSKALHISTNRPEAIVIGSDQVANLNEVAISKPGHHEAAVSQLKRLSGKNVVFHSAVCVIQQSTDSLIEFHVPTQVTFRTLSDEEIERYLTLEKPYDCAGSAKSEGLGITLLKRLESKDPTALIGLPLIQLSQTLRDLGIRIP